MKKRNLSCAIVILIVILLGIAGAALVVIFDVCPPQGPWPAPPWCDGSERRLLPSFPSNLPAPAAGPTFTVRLPANTPPHTVVYIEFFDAAGTPSGSYAMTPVSDLEWTFRASWLQQRSQADGSLYYRYNRDNLGYLSAEEFTPDSPAHYRTLVAGEVTEVHDVVEKWRWMPRPGEALPVVEAHPLAFALRVNGEAFQKGVVHADFWWDAFEPLIPSTNQRMREHGIEWVSISPTWDYLQVAPLPVIGIAGHSYQGDQLDLHLRQLRQDGFEIYLQPQVCCTVPPANVMDDAWWQAWLEQYRAFLMYNVEYARRYDVKYMAFQMEWYILENIPANYRRQLEGLFDEVRAAYPGKIGMDFYIGGNIGEFVYCQPVENAAWWDFFSVRLWAGIATRPDPTLDEVRRNVLAIFDTCLKPVHARYGKPIVLNQVAYPSVDGGLQGTTFLDGEDPGIQLWEPYTDTYTLDLEEQALGFDAILQAVAETPYIIGLYPFAYWPETLPLTKEYNIRDKPAEEVLRQWYQGIP